MGDFLHCKTCCMDCCSELSCVIHMNNIPLCVSSRCWGNHLSWISHHHALRLQHVKAKHEQPPHGRFGKALFIITGYRSASGRADVPTLMENLEMSEIDWKFLKRHGNSIAFFKSLSNNHKRHGHSLFKSVNTVFIKHACDWYSLVLFSNSIHQQNWLHELVLIS